MNNHRKTSKTLTRSLSIYTLKMSNSPPSHQPPKSILRNAPPPGTYDPMGSPELDSSGGGTQEIDRNQVLQNTRANAQLHDEGARLINESPSLNDEKSGESDHDLRWDEANIYKTEQERTSTMKIDEPKTPYQGPAGDSEYYLPDEDEDIVKTRDDKVIAVDELDEFSLGEPQYKETYDATLENDRIQKDEDDEEEEDEGREETAEEKHRRFEEMRKAHYHMKGNILRKPLPPDDEDEEYDN